MVEKAAEAGPGKRWLGGGGGKGKEKMEGEGRGGVRFLRRRELWGGGGEEDVLRGLECVWGVMYIY